LETINILEIVSREAIPILIFGHDWTFKRLYCDIPNCGNTVSVHSSCSN